MLHRFLQVPAWLSHDNLQHSSQQGASTHQHKSANKDVGALRGWSVWHIEGIR